MIDEVETGIGVALLHAGGHANANALNELGGTSASNTPSRPGFTPIWNP